MPPGLVSTLVFVPLVGYGLYRRLRRSFGRQPIGPRRMIARIVLLCAVCVVFLALSPSEPAFLAAGAGLGVGAVLALVGLRHTTFEATPEGRFYVPNKWLGLVVTALFLGRLAARMVTVSQQTAADPAAHGFAPPPPTPLTFGLLYLMATYYVAYYAGVLIKARSLKVAAESPKGG
jgi:hypothetical protein